MEPEFTGGVETPFSIPLEERKANENAFASCEELLFWEKKAFLRVIPLGRRLLFDGGRVFGALIGLRNPEGMPATTESEQKVEKVN